MPALRNSPAVRRWQFGSCEYVELSRTLIVNGQIVRMEAKPLDVLLQLLEHSNQVVGKEYLLDTVWADVETTEQSLTTAISKLRKAFAGPRDSVILNVAGIGYRITVPVTCILQEDGISPLVLQPGDPIPRRPHWQAVKRLSTNDLSPVWLARHEKSLEQRVYKFANDGIRLRALQREVAIFRVLTKSLGKQSSFIVRILDWSFEESPFFIESEYCGPNLLEWSKTEEFSSAPFQKRLRIAAYLANAVAETHSLAIFHNDLKPANILIANISKGRDGAMTSGSMDAANDLEIKIADFGVASLQNLNLLRELEISEMGIAADDALHDAARKRDVSCA